ncbi:hypothetical protein K443DRAFT_15375 [Laccaria amethystina LaAM-08-1]|uniref:Unplaced genomic scaffold K443scaffold_696, whole genome shotgun sequence n=1 Tax=Laccaria amethystina LaAM-08-1 TaxID=1095629 RepID=A0A0C9WXZ5_9AGAR|nr:hypothetical protein K443DRAFT_15375 [Laccaria amethystina LaAM-08-1]
MNSVNLSASTSTFGRSTGQRNTNRLSRNVNAIIDVEHPQMEPDEEADTLPPLMGRTLHGRGWDMDEAWHELESSTHHLYLWDQLAPVPTKENRTGSDVQYYRRQNQLVQEYDEDRWLTIVYNFNGAY